MMNRQPKQQNLATRGVPSAIELYIERLVLYDVPAGDRRSIGAAVERELARLLAEQGVPPSLMHGGTIAGLDAGTFEIRPGARANTIGVQVAQSVYRGLKR